MFPSDSREGHTAPSSRLSSFAPPSATEFSFQSDLDVHDLKERFTSAHISNLPQINSAIVDHSSPLLTPSSSDNRRASFFNEFKTPIRKTRPSKSFGDSVSGWGSRVRRVTQSSFGKFFHNNPTLPAKRNQSFSEKPPLMQGRSASNASACTCSILKRPRTASTPVDTATKRRQSGVRQRDPPIHSFDPMGGAAARQFARDFGKGHLMVRQDSGISGRGRVFANESGVHLTLDGHPGDVQPVEKDPVKHLPFDLSVLVFSQLDSRTLARCSSVSKDWKAIAEDSWIWRRMFLAKYDSEPHRPTTYANITVPRGLGRTRAENQPWKQMHGLRKQLSRRWANGQAAVTYLTGHTDSVYCVQFDEDKVVTGSRDRTIRVWDTKTGRLRKVIGMATAHANDRRDAPDTPQPTSAAGLPVVSSSGGVAHDTTLYHVPEMVHNASILCLQYDDKICVTGSSDRSLIVWDIATWTPLQRLSRHSAGVLDVAFDEAKLVSCSKDGTICVWDRATGNCLLQLTGHRGPVNAVQLRDNLIVSASGEGCAKLWRLSIQGLGTNEATATAVCIKSFWSTRKGLACVEFSNDGKFVYAGGGDEAIFKYSTATGKLAQTFQGHSSLVRSLYLDNANNRLVSGSYDLSLRVWDATTGAQIQRYGEAPESHSFTHQHPPSAAIARAHALREIRDRERSRLTSMTSDTDSAVDSSLPPHGEPRHPHRTHSAQNILAMANAAAQHQHQRQGQNGWVGGVSTQNRNQPPVQQQVMQPQVHGAGLASSWMLSAKSDYRRIIGTSQDGRAVIVDFGWGVPGIHLLEG